MAMSYPELNRMVAVDINIAASGDTTLIAGVTGSPIRVYQIVLVANAAVNVIFKDGSTAFNAFAIPLTAQGTNITLPYSGVAWWSTSNSNAFKINLSGSVQITGRAYYTVG
jgi:hypothetical protein